MSDGGEGYTNVWGNGCEAGNEEVGYLRCGT